MEQLDEKIIESVHADHVHLQMRSRTSKLVPNVRRWVAEAMCYGKIIGIVGGEICCAIETDGIANGVIRTSSRHRQQTKINGIVDRIIHRGIICIQFSHANN